MTSGYFRISKLSKLLYFLPGLLLLYLSFDSGTEPTTKSNKQDNQGSWYDSYRNIFSPRAEPTAPPTKTIILLGMKPHWKEFCNYPEMSRFRKLIKFPRIINCPGLTQNITMEYSEEAKDIRGADIVVFTNVYQWLTPDMWEWVHGNRSEHQPWVMISLESPLYVPGFQPPDQFRDTTYNWIASYKLDSEIHLPYGYFKPYGDDKPPEVDLKQFVANKTKVLAWMSSNCNTFQWERHKFVEDIHQIVQVDKYGKCGEQEIPWNDQKAVKSVFENYKFYLSLENSCCDDYISEKFWRALDIGMVPVVVGASLEQYEQVAPPNSFIHVDQFHSLAEMAIHITMIANDEEQFLKYFQWRNLGNVTVYSMEDQYVTPLMETTHCSLLQHYLQTNRTHDKSLEYLGKKWGDSCKSCGTKWITSYLQK